MSKVGTLDEQKSREGRFAVVKDMWLRRRIGKMKVKLEVALDARWRCQISNEQVSREGQRSGKLRDDVVTTQALLVGS